MPRHRHARSGFTLVEILIALVLTVALMAGVNTLFRSQSTSFRNNTNRFDLVQNLRSALEQSERTIRTMGAGVSGQQPIVVYANTNVLAFNADFVENDTTDVRWATYWNPDAPDGETAAWLSSAATVIPNTTYTYPTTTYTLGNGTLSPAETYSLYLQSDSSTTRSDDYVLYERVNAGTATVVARNILAPSNSKPFFEYLMKRSLSTGDTIIVAPSSMLPLIRRSLSTATNATDSAAYARPDSIRAVRMRLRVTNGKSGTEEQIREIETVMEAPNNGVPMPTVCGRAPIAPGTLTLTDPGLGDGRLTVAWTSSTDQESGERDVRQYIVWRRLASETAFREPLLVVRAESGTSSYSTVVQNNTPSTAYVFAVAAQDCTPSVSSSAIGTVTTSAAP